MSRTVFIGLRLCAALAGVFASSVAWAGTATYGYDSFGRVVSATNTDGVITNYTYDNAGNRTFQSITVTKPIARAVSISVQQNSPGVNVPLTILGAPATVAGVYTVPSHGVANASGLSITYTPVNGYYGPDAFQYFAAVAAGQPASDPAIVSINVYQIPPVVANVTQTIAVNSVNNPVNLVPVNLILLGGPPSSVAASGGPSHGSLSVSGTSMAYTPNSGFNGTDTFQYTASNSAGPSNVANVTLTVSNNASIWGHFAWGTGSSW